MIFKCGDIVMYGASFTVCNSPTQKIGVVIEVRPPGITNDYIYSMASIL